MRNQQVSRYPERWQAKNLQPILRFRLTSRGATIPLEQQPYRLTSIRYPPEGDSI